MKAFYEREIKRVSYAGGRRDIRRREKNDKLSAHDKVRSQESKETDDEEGKTVTISEGGSVSPSNEDSAESKERAKEEAFLQVHEMSYQKMLEEYKKTHGLA